MEDLSFSVDHNDIFDHNPGNLLNIGCNIMKYEYLSSL